MDDYEVECYVKAGKIASEIKKFAFEIVKPGMKLIYIAEAIDQRIVDLGGDFGFPVNLSLNEIAAHYTPAPGDETVAQGILKIDIGVAVDGFIADCAISIDLTEDKRFSDMIELNKKILAAASEVVRPEMEVKDVGDAVQGVIEDAQDERFAVIKTLCGHSLDQDQIHAGLTISNYRNNNSTVLKDMAFAIEPFVTTGVGDIFEGKGGGIYALQGNGQVRDREARKLLDFIWENYSTRPFCARWLLKAGFARWKFLLGSLVRAGVLYEYPVLIEKSRKPVSQVENTFVLARDKVICTTE